MLCIDTTYQNNGKYYLKDCATNYGRNGGIVNSFKVK